MDSLQDEGAPCRTQIFRSNFGSTETCVISARLPGQAFFKFKRSILHILVCTVVTLFVHGVVRSRGPRKFCTSVYHILHDSSTCLSP